MPDAGRWLVDTNILVRILVRMIDSALRTLVAEGARLCFSSQTLGEFLNASNPPAR